MPNLIERRRVLAGAAGLMLAGCAAGDDRIVPNGAAYDPWRNWRGDASDGKVALVRAAILSANAHDTQPWQFGLEPNAVTLYADPRRNLGAMDAFRREMHLSLGCALENLCLIAGAHGFAARVEPVPGDVRATVGPNGPRLVARIGLAAADSTPSPLVAEIPRRHTNRGAYDAGRSVSQERLAGFSALAAQTPDVRLQFVTDRGAQRDFAQATVAATTEIIDDATMIADSDAWFRGSAAEIEAHRDGPTIACAGLSPMMRFLADVMPTPSPQRSHDFWLSHTRDVQVATAGAFGLLLVRDLYDLPQALAAGRVWQRLHLEATRLGLGMQPLNQLPERVDRELMLGRQPETAKRLAALTSMPGWYPTFAFRCGWPTDAAFASPRRDVTSVLLTV